MAFLYKTNLSISHTKEFHEFFDKIEIPINDTAG